jgi:histidine triad (HIT) family protein
MTDCLFCKIANGGISAKKALETTSLLAFYDIDPKAPVHILIIPKKHIASNNEVAAEDEVLIGSMFTAAKKIAADLGIADDGYRLVFNCGRDGGQAVTHLHLHLLGGRQLGWPPG